jgi:hypothetical protein
VSDAKVQQFEGSFDDYKSSIVDLLMAAHEDSSE